MTQRGEDTWESVLRFLRRTEQVMDANLRDRIGSGLDEYDVLHQLVVAEVPLRMGDLAQRLLVANSSCHRLVTRLAGAGLVTREPGTQDRREIHVRITSAGRALHRRMAAVHTRDIEREFTDRLTNDEIRTVGRIFDHLGAGADRA